MARKLWVKEVQETSHALELPEDIFTKSPKIIARALKEAAENRGTESKARTPYQAAMSMLNFYINRGGKNVSAAQKENLEQAKEELKKLFNRD